MALSYIRLLEATLFLGAPDEGLKYRTEVKETLSQFSYLLIKKSDEALLYCDAKFKSAIGGRKGKKPPETRWEKFASQALQDLSTRTIDSYRYKTGNKEGQLRIGQLATLIGSDIFDKCVEENIRPPKKGVIEDRLLKLFKPLDIKENIKIQRK